MTDQPLPSSSREAIATLAAELSKLPRGARASARRLIYRADVIFAEAFGPESPEYLDLLRGYQTLTSEPGPISPFAFDHERDTTDYWQEGVEIMTVAFEAAVLKLSRRPSAPTLPLRASFVSEERLRELVALAPVLLPTYDLGRLVRLCQELNASHQSGSYHAVILLLRALLDHVPPLLGHKTFADVASQYGGGPSFKNAMRHLEASARHIANIHLHRRVGPAEPLPTEQTAGFSPDLELLLAEICRRNANGV